MKQNACNYVSPSPRSKSETQPCVSHFLPPVLSPSTFWNGSVTAYQGTLKCFPPRVPLKDMGQLTVFILVGATIFQWLSRHSWPVASILDSMGLNNDQFPPHPVTLLLACEYSQECSCPPLSAHTFCLERVSSVAPFLGVVGEEPVLAQSLTSVFIGYPIGS